MARATQNVLPTVNRCLYLIYNWNWILKVELFHLFVGQFLSLQLTSRHLLRSVGLVQCRPLNGPEGRPRFHKRLSTTFYKKRNDDHCHRHHRHHQHHYLPELVTITVSSWSPSSSPPSPLNLPYHSNHHITIITIFITTTSIIIISPVPLTSTPSSSSSSPSPSSLSSSSSSSTSSSSPPPPSSSSYHHLH